MRAQAAVTPIDSGQYSQSEKAAASARQSSGWLAAFAVIWCAAASLALLTAYECSSIFHPSSLVYGLVLWLWWGCVASVLWMAGERKPFLSEFSPQSILLHTSAAAALGYVHIVALWSLGFTGMGWYAGLPMWKAFHALMNINRFGIEVLVYGFVFGLVGIVQYQLRAQRERVRSLELERQLSAAQLRALQMQLEPHFLFNTLNAITTLVELGRQQEAVEMLSHLNAILKSTLKRTTPEKVPLWQEMEIVENYLAIEQVRFADRLRIEIKVEPGALDSLVPCFLLQPIVENAIRHGIAYCESDGIVEASARREGNLLRLEVRNSGLRANASSRPGNGIGLKNTRERLMHFYRDAFDMQAAPLETGGFKVAIAIPYERR
jgi:hypothetical protein